MMSAAKSYEPYILQSDLCICLCTNCTIQNPEFHIYS